MGAGTGSYGGVTALLLCVDGSAASMAATRVALQLAAELHAELHAIFVVEDSGLASLIDQATGGHTASERLGEAGEALRARVVALAATAGIAIHWIVDRGEAFDRILEHARHLQPRFVVMGRTGRRGPGRALVGSQVEQTLEFTEWPVIVVPATSTAAPDLAHRAPG